MKTLNYLFALALLFTVACSGEKTSTEEVEVVEVEEVVAEQPKDIVTLALENESLTTLVAALKAGGLVETLQGAGPFTVFAPTNQAFAALPEGTVEDLLKPENKDKLVAILTYHVVPGKVISTDLTDGMKASTVNGQDITITTTDGAKVNGASVIAADVDASNGVVHLVDAVLLPPAM
ncbi:fasciclin domain-containing protein [Algoriphagus yeomjeoni]|uniref:fasciclin domain-containing protein n=1 Tax=Algoriphagus yeomjeoni TaxID=291403 RepID=UPI003CE4A1CB